MRLSTCLLPFTITAVSALAPTQSPPFGFKHVFSAHITINPGLTPINVPGGVTVIEPITGGTISGSALNGTVLGGFAYPSIYYNQTLDVPSITLYGRTTDNQTFYVSEMGTGTPSSQVTKIQALVNGTKYQEIANGFLLASVIPTNRTSVHVEAFLVTNRP